MPQIREMRKNLLSQLFTQRSFRDYLHFLGQRSGEVLALGTSSANTLGFMGNGYNMGKKYWKGDSPLGWPVLVDWSKFKGPSKNCSMALCSEIIFSLMEGQDLLPMNHGPLEEVEDTEVEETDTKVEETGSEVEHTNAEKSDKVNPRKRTRNNIAEIIAERQNREERNLSAYKRRKKNISEFKAVWEALEDSDE